MSSILRFVRLQGSLFGVLGLQCPFVFRFHFFCCLWHPILNSKIARMKLGSLSLPTFYFQQKISKKRQLSDPNSVQGLSFTDVLIIINQIMILSANYSAKQGITQYFDQEYKRIPRKGAKGSFFGFFWTLARPG